MSEDAMNVVTVINQVMQGLNEAEREYVHGRIEVSVPQAIKLIAENARKELQDEGKRRLMAGYQAEVMNVRQGDVRGLSELKRRYRALGLEVW